MTTCSLRLDGDGLTVDGRASDIDAAIESCRAAARTALVLADDAPSSAYAALVAAFERAGIPIAHAARRNARRPRGRRQAAPRYALEGGRTILRDDQPIVTLQRIDLGNERYALSPHETDGLARQIVDLLNGKRRRQSGAATPTHRIFMFQTTWKGGAEVHRHWFEADPPVTWDEAKRRLVAAKLIDERIMAWGADWKLVGDPPLRVRPDWLRPLP
jgi:hypothetical protein